MRQQGVHPSLSSAESISTFNQNCSPDQTITATNKHWNNHLQSPATGKQHSFSSQPEKTRNPKNNFNFFYFPLHLLSNLPITISLISNYITSSIKRSADNHSSLR
ncbi:hypothetical protein PGT21_031054 [Puccinia graminis f. sp. tritici]|uniref:Uncharacterized protein n=1 Tax=Puccinia graminis f. sp. tritici TaxID=56615 RepID=A0A5B0Q4D4_PUCGR|nr:hypothetical protein PGT21_031054 [Puccinia graminis f. sp. tritici]KAA1107962.1 hypothetical protein PGTUg99_017247 [Puccinia graminis f. sp. tritici]